MRPVQDQLQEQARIMLLNLINSTSVSDCCNELILAILNATPQRSAELM